MLTKREDMVMKVIYNICQNRKSILLSPDELIKKVGREHITRTQLEKVMTDLATDRYFDLVYSDRKGETIYCIALTDKGKGYQRDKQIFKRNMIARLFLTAIFAMISFIIGIILKAVF